MHVIVINRNQQEFVEPMIKALAPINPLFVFDRCEPVKNCQYKLNTKGEGFLAGLMRDIGAEGIDDDILFLDGDKVPQGNIIADIEALKHKYDCICYGVNGEFEESQFRSLMKNDNMDGIVEWQKRNFPYAYGCYSCGLWISKNAIRKLRELNNGRIFHPAFDGTWGDEDNFLADELGYCNFKIGYSTHVRLSGKFSDCTNTKKYNGLTKNFIKRIRLRKLLFNARA